MNSAKHHPGLLLTKKNFQPPQPVMTCWCVLHKAAEYYTKSFEANEEIVQAFPDTMQLT
jgi:hypothetical protein